MPELPEVETIRRQLQAELPGLRIEKCKVGLGRLVTHPSPRTYCRNLAGRTIGNICRRGKYLIFELDNHLDLVIHLGMTGSLSLVESPREYPRHTHIVFGLSDGRQLIYVDPRTFGETAVLKHADYSPLRGLASIGPEPLATDFTPERLAAALKGTALIKAALLDQRRIAGLGNIYADEILHRAGINPCRRLNELSPVDIERLHTSIHEVLNEAINGRGSTISDYVDLEGEKGGFQNLLRVYGRSDEGCPVCGERICMMRIAGRSSHYCPSCQK
ncbi:MAG: DNA-formamidopyrimidine glycosylase [Candidatus Solincola sediminis]|uniref:Formamidopyrimidine-DNA glycosylase n=1 Tax=Candidatus Solincola sediminis TaxID=1797199 RepID=A0A1F2WKB4_9ACTN|nr:MAG: DNA-formamidopyrimidine glycosylase [Candidatus Solincola sediminis]